MQQRFGTWIFRWWTQRQIEILNILEFIEICFKEEIVNCFKCVFILNDLGCFQKIFYLIAVVLTFTYSQSFILTFSVPIKPIFVSELAVCWNNVR